MVAGEEPLPGEAVEMSVRQKLHIVSDDRRALRFVQGSFVALRRNCHYRSHGYLNEMQVLLRGDPEAAGRLEPEADLEVRWRGG